MMTILVLNDCFLGELEIYRMALDCSSGVVSVLWNSDSSRAELFLVGV